MAARLRAFVAADLPGAVREALEGVQGELRRRGITARWVRPEGLHLTLKFLGDIAADQAAAAGEALRIAAAGHPRLRLEAAGVGVFPGLRRARVLWVGIAGETESLTALQRRLEERMAGRGFPPEERPFRAHLTIGRFSAPVDPAMLGEAVEALGRRRFGAFEVREVVLYRSDLKPGGAVYTPLARAALEEPPQA